MTTSRWATAAGVTGLAANALLVAFYALEVGRVPPLPVSLGTLNDVVGAAGTAMMIPVAMAVGGRRVRALGVTATVVLTSAGVLLVIGVLPFSTQLPITLTAFLGLATWILLVSPDLDGQVRRLGRLCGGAALAGAGVAGLGALLPAMSWPQLALFGIGGVPAVLAVLAMPLWFLRLGRALRSATPRHAEAGESGR
jgi:hypothetical protein